MKLTTLFWLCKAGVLVFFALLILGLTFKMTWMIVVGVVILVDAAVLFQWKYRCPYCHKVLDSRSLTPSKCCPRCGKKLR